MSTIIIHSADLKPDTSKADIVVVVEPGESIAEKITLLALTIQRQIEPILPCCFNELHILCNNTKDGLALGKIIDARNVSSIFLPLKYKIGNIHIFCPNAASNYYQANNGMLMCRRLAQTTYANVRASNSYNGKLDIVTWNQRGKMIMLDRYDESGALCESYDHPGELLLHNFKALCRKSTDVSIRPTSIRLFLRKKIRHMRLSPLSLLHSFFSKHAPVWLRTK